MPDDDGKREAGFVAATLQSIDRRLEHIEKRLDDWTEWQRSTDSRLASGAEKFSHLERRDSIGSVLASLVGILAAIGAGIFGSTKQ